MEGTEWQYAYRYYPQFISKRGAAGPRRDQGAGGVQVFLLEDFPVDTCTLAFFHRILRQSIRVKTNKYSVLASTSAELEPSLLEKVVRQQAEWYGAGESRIQVHHPLLSLLVNDNIQSRPTSERLK